MDRALGRHVVPNAIRAAGHVVEVHADHFRDDCEDATWLPVVATRGWVVLTKDGRIAKNAPERRAVATCGARVFALNNANLSGPEQAAALLIAIPRILAALDAEQAPFIAVVGRDGRIDIRIRFPATAAAEPDDVGC